MVNHSVVVVRWLSQPWVNMRGCSTLGIVGSNRVWCFFVYGVCGMVFFFLSITQPTMYYSISTVLFSKTELGYAVFNIR